VELFSGTALVLEKAVLENGFTALVAGLPLPKFKSPAALNGSRLGEKIRVVSLSL